MGKITKLNTQPNKNIEKTFLEYYMNDLPVIPVDPNTRRPTLKKWGQFQHVLPTLEHINEWKQAEGVALITGHLSGIVILDVDCKNGKDGFKHLKDKQLPITPVVKTQSGGYHYYFKHPGNDLKVKTASDLLGKNTGIDIRGDGGYAVIPNTPGYEFVSGLSFDDVELAELPSWLSDLVVTQKNNKRGVTSNEYALLDTPPQDTHKKVQLLGNLNKDHLNNWYRSEEVTRAFMKQLGLEHKNIGESFNCILPGHEEQTPSASFYQADNGIYVYRDFHGEIGRQTLLLPEVYASIYYKKVITLDKVKGLTDKTISTPEFSVWAIRLLVDLGFIEPYEVTKKELPKGVKPTVVKTYEAFIHLLGCKWLYSPGEPTPFSWRFAHVWAGVNYKKVGDCMKWLIDNDYLEITGTERMRGRDVTLFNIKD